jgi:hypothetical protein
LIDIIKLAGREKHKNNDKESLNPYITSNKPLPDGTEAQILCSFSKNTGFSPFIFLCAEYKVVIFKGFPIETST